MPGVLFVKASYRYVLRREADEVGLQHYVQLLSRGCGKQAVLLDLLNSREGRRVGQHNDSKPIPATLFRELEQLKKSNGSYIKRLWRDSRRTRELNALRFDLEVALAGMFDNLRDGMTRELQQRAVYPADSPGGAAGPSSVVEVLQAHRRAVSRPASQR